MISRRAALASAGVAALARPALAQAPRVLRMVPQANLASLDPVWSTANITRNHGFMIYDTLYGLTAGLEPTPQMAAGHLVEEDGRRVTVMLRDGLAFHDGEPVRAGGCGGQPPPLDGAQPVRPEAGDRPGQPGGVG